jgi:hypothetical protein
MKRVYVATDPVDAHLRKGVLEGAGLKVIVQGEALWGARGALPLTPETCPSVWVVNDSDYERALTLLARSLPSEDGLASGREEWHCEGCGERNEAPFSACWQCGKGRPLL